MAPSPVPSRRIFIGRLGMGAIGLGAGAAASREPIAQTPEIAAAGPLPQSMFRDRAAGAVAHPIATILDSDLFISAYRFMTAEEIADAQGYRGTLDLTRALQAALDAAWSTNRDLFVPAGLYRVKTLVLPGGQARRSSAFRVYGQGSGELFARAEDGGTILKGTGNAPVLVSKQDRTAAGNGNQEVAYIRFEGSADQAVLDFATLFGQSELHHCGIFQSGSGDGVRIRQANTIEVHHNYVLNRDWAAPSTARRTGCGIRVTTNNDNGLTTLRKNTARGFDWAFRLGGDGSGRIFSVRIEQCEASACTNGILLSEGIDGAVVDNCYLEGGGGGTAIRNLGSYNTLSNNFVFPGFGIGIDDRAPSRATRITGNTLSAGSRTTIATGGCTLLLIDGAATTKTVSGNAFICDPVSGGGLDQVVGIEIAGQEPGLDIRGNSFDPLGDWGHAPRASQIVDRSVGRGATGAMQLPAGMPLLARGAVSLGRVELGADAFAGETLRLPPGSWFQLPKGSRRVVRAIDGAAKDGRVVVVWDRHGTLALEASPLVRLDGGRAFAGPGTITLLLQAEGGGTEALELSRAVF